MDFQNFRTFMVELDVVGVTGGNTQPQANFTLQSQLTNAPTWWLETYTVTDVAVSPNGFPLISASQMAGAFLCLYCSDVANPTNQGLWFYQLPLVDLHVIQNQESEAFNRHKFMLNGQCIAWEKSYIQLAQPLGNDAGTTLAILINVGYSQGSVIQGKLTNT